MSTGKSYIVRLLRRVESLLSNGGHADEASKVGRIMQKVAQADDIHDALEVLRKVEGLDDFALRLMWLLDVAEKGEVGLENGVMDYQASVLGTLITAGTGVKSRENVAAVTPLPDRIDQLYVSLHKFGRAIEELKRHSIGDGVFAGVEERRICDILNELASLGEHAADSGKKDLSQFVSACSGFAQYVLDNGVLHDVRVVNILDNANITLQTVFEAAGAEDLDSLQSTIQLLSQPNELLN
jgi:hypothetical protein